jgi:hypothetical protein
LRMSLRHGLSGASCGLLVAFGCRESELFEVM